jgi:RNA polymerase sigma-70 factor (ECF subfamily)
MEAARSECAITAPLRTKVIKVSGENSAFQNVEHFMRLFTESERKIYIYIASMMPDLTAADDIFQETSMVLWRKFSEFQPGTSFPAWAYRIALNLVKRYYAKQQRSRLVFDAALLEILNEDARIVAEQLDANREAVLDCLQRLRPRDRDLIRRRYEKGATVAKISELIGRPVDGIYKALQRIHKTLYACVKRKLAQDM